MKALFLSLLLFGVAHANEDEVTFRARAHFEAGRALYTLGRYDDALREFVAGYQLVPRPQFLLDMAHCQRKLGRIDEARSFYQRYLAASPNDPRAPEVRRILSELAETPPPPVGVKVAESPPQVVIAPPPPVRHSKWRRYGWIPPVAAVVIAGLGVGIYFAVHPSDPYHCASAGLGCVDATH